MDWIIRLLIFFSAIASAWQYEPGVSYKYHYHFTILLNEDSNITSRSASVGRDVGYRVSSDFLLTNVWQNGVDIKEKLLKLEIIKPTLHVSSTLHSSEGTMKHWSKLDNLSYPPIYIHWSDGLIKKVYILPDVESMTNIKKGLASLFQVHVLTGEETKEMDVSGLCQVNYQTEQMMIKKRKFNCKRTEKTNMNSMTSDLRSSTMAASSELLFKLMPDKNIVQSVTGTEEVMIKLNSWNQAAVFVKSKIKLTYLEQHQDQPFIGASSLKSALSSISKVSGSILKDDNLEVSSPQNLCIDCKPLKSLISEYYENLLPENLATLKSATGFLKLLEGFRKANEKELLIMFKDADERIQSQLLDILAVTPTEAALNVAFELIDFEGDELDVPERFLICLSASPNPSEIVLSKTFKLAKKRIRNSKIKATVMITLSALVKTFCEKNPHHAESKVVEKAVTWLLGELKGCLDDSCSLIYLQALRSAAQPRSIPVLLEYIKRGEKVGLTSLEALKNIGTRHFTEEVKEVLFKVYNQFWPKQDSECRVLAAELLIKSSPTKETISSILLSLSDREFPEVNSLVLSKLLEAGDECDAVRSSISDLLKNATIRNYNTLSQNGSSTAYRRLMQAMSNANVSYGINLEMRPTGMLKRTNMDLKLKNNNTSLQLLSLGLFVQGFGLTDEEQKAKEIPEEHSAGMELSILGVHLRPYTFFTGTAELMGLVWSSAGSEPTPALQANFLIMDHTSSFILQNGVPLDFTLKGALSTDISGTISVSIWNKNSQAGVKNSAALLVQGSCRVDTSFVESHIDFALGGSVNLNMIVDLDYSVKPMQMCLQMEQPDLIFRHNVRKTETIPGSKHLIKTVKRRSLYYPGRSFALHQKNYNSCKKLLFPKPESYW